MAREALKRSEEKFKALYEQSKKSEEIYRSLINSSADAVVLYDLDGRTMYVSPSFTKLFGWTLDELQGKRIPLVPESEKEMTYSIIKELIETGKPCHNYETKRLTKDGRILDISISASRYHDHKGKPLGMLVVLRDISDKKRLEAQLSHAQKMEAIGTLTGGIAHDFNNILQSIMGYAEILMMEKPENHPDLRILNSIKEATERGADLVQRLLLFGRKVETRMRPLDLNYSIAEVKTILEETIPKMIRIETDLANDLKLINADPVQIQQVLMNLGVNARDAMPDGGRLQFRTRNITVDDAFCIRHPGLTPGNYALLTVSDTGHGIDKGLIEHIFEPFFTTKERGKGTGLGLSIVYGIIKAHGGYITCQSDPGIGTTFQIYFPVIEGMPESKKKEILYGDIRGGNETILVVDDEISITNFAKEVLSRFGYRVVVALSGEEAIEKYTLEKENIHLVLLDLNMPGMGGQRCLKRLMHIDPSVKIIISTGYLNGDSDTGDISGYRLHILRKPYNAEDLLKIIRSVLDHS
jgi:PAS domain S-box-containing protein